MRLIWNKDSDPYKAAEEKIFQLYPKIESFVIQLKAKHKEDDEWCETTELLLNMGYDWQHPIYIWENDWWEGEQFVELVAAAPISRINLNNEWRI